MWQFLDISRNIFRIEYVDFWTFPTLSPQVLKAPNKKGFSKMNVKVEILNNFRFKVLGY